MGKGYLIDTNAIIVLLGGALPEASNLWLNNILAQNEHYLSVINQIELLGFSTKAAETKVLNEFVDASVVLALTEEVVQETISLRKAHKIKLPDAIIAATAITYGLQLITRNTADFKSIEGLHCLNAHDQ